MNAAGPDWHAPLIRAPFRDRRETGVAVGVSLGMVAPVLAGRRLTRTPSPRNTNNGTQRRHAMLQRHQSGEGGLPFSLAVRAGDTLYLSGQLGNIPGQMRLAEGGIEGQTRQMMENIGAILAAHGLSFSHVVKCTVMLADMAEWQAFNRIYLAYFDKAELPARSAFGASGLALGAAVEMECIAYMGGKA